MKINIGFSAAKWLGCGALVVSVAACSSDKTPPQAPTSLAQEGTTQRSQTARNDADTTIHVSDEIMRECQLPSTAQEAPHFEYAGSTLRAHGQNVLDDVAKCAKDGNLRGRVITIIGRTDPRGSAAYNQELSADRAQAARKYLVEHGASSQNLRLVARGESDAHGSDEASWALDRRVDFELGPLGSDRAPVANENASPSPATDSAHAQGGAHIGK
jgi:outer membrane protein OmpA-like peptidoglycan-associated protein